MLPATVAALLNLCYLLILFQGTKDPLFLTGVTFPSEYPIYEETRIKLTVYDVKDKSHDTVSTWTSFSGSRERALYFAKPLNFGRHQHFKEGCLHCTCVCLVGALCCVLFKLIWLVTSMVISQEQKLAGQTYLFPKKADLISWLIFLLYF